MNKLSYAVGLAPHELDPQTLRAKLETELSRMNSIIDGLAVRGRASPKRSSRSKAQTTISLEELAMISQLTGLSIEEITGKKGAST